MLAFSKRIIHAGLARCNLGLVPFFEKRRKAAMLLIRKVSSERRMLLIPAEAYQIISTVRNTAKLSGDIAEVGTFQGASAKLIAETDSTRVIHLFDTFQGLPLPGYQDPSFTEGQFACSLPQVKASLSQYGNVRFYKGQFPDSAGPIENTWFSFVHLDVDLYQSMSDSLRFFYSRMVPGGIILCHDFSSIPAITLAVEEFFSDKPEPVIELSGNQCLIVRLGSSSPQ